MHRFRLALLLSTLVALSSPSLAQVNDAKRASYRAAFEETLRHPGDAEVLLRTEDVKGVPHGEIAIVLCERP